MGCICQHLFRRPCEFESLVNTCLPRQRFDKIQSVNQPGGPTEFDLGKIIIDAAAEAGVQRLVYSSGADTETLTNGEVYCRMMMSMMNEARYRRPHSSHLLIRQEQTP